MNPSNDRPMTVGEWFVTLLVLALPLIGVVMYLYWAFADGVNENKRNFCRAGLLWFVLMLGLGMMILMLGGFAALVSNAS